jgi:hypothetical protein
MPAAPAIAIAINHREMRAIAVIMRLLAVDRLVTPTAVEARLFL